MAIEADKDQGSGQSSSAAEKDTAVPKKKQQGIISRIWNGLFRIHGDDFEKRLQHISKEEASVLARMKRRSQSWRRLTRNLIILSVILEVIAVGYAIMTTRSVDLNWKMRALCVLPMFLLPGLSSAAYAGIAGEERFSIELDENDKVWYEVLSFSKPANFLSVLGYPYVQSMQKQFARLSTNAVLKHASS